ncbi:MAG: sulfotransferase, partial [Gammaproteobacteria bacterium]
MTPLQATQAAAHNLITFPKQLMAHFLQHRKGVFLFAPPRSGTNLFCALLHNHPALYAVSHNGTKKFLDAVEQQGNTALRGATIADSADCIYPKGGPRKPMDGISHVIYDKVHYVRSKHWRYHEQALELTQKDDFSGIVMVRHPVAVLQSMDGFHRRHVRPRWAFTVENTAEYYHNFFRVQIELLREGRFHAVMLESFLANMSEEYPELCRFLGIPFIDHVTDFRASFKAAGAPSGRAFEVREVSDYAGAALEAKGYQPPPEPRFVDPGSGEHTLGLGG